LEKNRKTRKKQVRIIRADKHASTANKEEVGEGRTDRKVAKKGLV
jgi:hypothetical protein